MNVTIRPLEESDAYTSVNWRNDPEVFKYTGTVYQDVINVNTELEWIRKVIANSKDYRCAILADGVYVGNIYLTDIDGGIAHYHIFIGNKNYWGKGVAKSASDLILQYGFKSLNLNKILLRVRKHNCRAIILYEKLGFKAVNVLDDWITMVITKHDYEDGK